MLVVAVVAFVVVVVQPKYTAVVDANLESVVSDASTFNE